MLQDIATKCSADYAAIMSAPTITAIILAGGKGRRMDYLDKGLVTYQGKPLIQHAIEKIEPQVQNIIISYNRNEAEYKKLPYPSVIDVTQDYLGPLLGILSCRHLIKSEFFFVMPCDMPRLPGNIVSALCEKLDTSDLCIAHDGVRMQPLLFVAKTQLIESIKDYLDGGGRSVKKWIKSKDHVTVDFSSQLPAFWNINETSQLRI